jgi:hypothetical protein
MDTVGSSGRSGPILNPATPTKSLASLFDGARLILKAQLSGSDNQTLSSLKSPGFPVSRETAPSEDVLTIETTPKPVAVKLFESNDPYIDSVFGPSSNGKGNILSESVVFDDARQIQNYEAEIIKMQERIKILSEVF